MAVVGRNGQWEDGSGGRGGCCSMEIRGRAEDLGINVLFLFFSLFTDGKFAKFGLPRMEGDSRRGETFFASQVWWVQGWEHQFSEGGSATLRALWRGKGHSFREGPLDLHTGLGRWMRQGEGHGFLRQGSVWELWDLVGEDDECCSMIF